MKPPLPWIRLMRMLTCLGASIFSALANMLPLSKISHARLSSIRTMRTLTFIVVWRSLVWENIAGQSPIMIRPSKLIQIMVNPTITKAWLIAARVITSRPSRISTKRSLLWRTTPWCGMTAAFRIPIYVIRFPLMATSRKPANWGFHHPHHSEICLSRRIVRYSVKVKRSPYHPVMWISPPPNPRRFLPAVPGRRADPP